MLLQPQYSADLASSDFFYMIYLNSRNFCGSRYMTLIWHLLNLIAVKLCRLTLLRHLPSYCERYDSWQPFDIHLTSIWQTTDNSQLIWAKLHFLIKLSKHIAFAMIKVGTTTVVNRYIFFLFSLYILPHKRFRTIILIAFIHLYLAPF